jgi:cell division protein FtsQ
MTRKTVAAATELPADVRLMNGVATLLFAAATLALLAAAGGALARLPQFAIGAVRIDGDVARNSVTTLRANAMPKLSGSWFTLDLDSAKRAFESAPWVRQAVVSRVWPNRLAVRLEEHRAVAQWQDAQGGERLVNAYGEVFDANLGDVEDDALPRFAGPDGSAARMLAMHGRLQPLLAAAFVAERAGAGRIATLALSGRGSWRVELDSGAELELGRGVADDADRVDGADGEVLVRTERFLRTLPQIRAQYEQRALLYADLRHRDGYALKLRGITTSVAAGTNATPNEHKR